MSDTPYTTSTAGTPVSGATSTTSTMDTSSSASSATDEARHAASGVAGEAKERAGEVVHEAGQRARGLVDQARSEVTSQAGTQQDRLAQGLRHLGSELDEMSRVNDDPGYASDLAHRGSDAMNRLADWFEQREPGDVVRDVQDFARRRPGMFLAVAAGAGLVVGRLVRGARDQGGTGSGSVSRSGSESTATSATSATSSSSAAGVSGGIGEHATGGAQTYPPTTTGAYPTGPTDPTGGAYPAGGAAGTTSGGVRDVTGS